MASITVEEGLRRYEIGKKVRALRLRKKMGLVELGRHSGFSPALISKIESSKIFPPLGTLLRIAMVFGVGLDHFFSDAREKAVVAVVRKGDRIRLEHGSFRFESLDFRANDRTSSAFLAEFLPAARGDAPSHEHPGHETIYVLSGKLAVMVDREEIVLETGDSLYFDSSVPHSYRRSGTSRCEAVVMTVP